MSYVPLGDEVWGCLPVVASYEVHYIAMLESDLSVIDQDPDDPYRKRLLIERSGIPIMLIWCQVRGEDTSVRFLVPEEAPPALISAASEFMEKASRRARAQKITHSPAGFGRGRAV